MGSKNDESYFTLEKYECYWLDSVLHTEEWKDIEEAKKNTPVIVCTEGFLIKKNKSSTSDSNCVGCSASSQRIT